jgi:hypothetical protein
VRKKGRGHISRGNVPFLLLFAEINWPPPGGNDQIDTGAQYDSLESQAKDGDTGKASRCK